MTSLHHHQPAAGAVPEAAQEFIWRNEINLAHQLLLFFNFLAQNKTLDCEAAAAAAAAAELNGKEGHARGKRWQEKGRSEEEQWGVLI